LKLRVHPDFEFVAQRGKETVLNGFLSPLGPHRTVCLKLYNECLLWFDFKHGFLPRLRDGTPLDASRMIVLLFLHTYIYTDQKAASFKLIG